MATRTAEDVRKYVSERLARDDGRLRQPKGTLQPQSLSSEGQMISGPDLARVSKRVDGIPDAVIRGKIMGAFAAMTKYQALAMILDPAGPFRRDYSAQVDAIAADATEIDYQAEKIQTRIV